MIWNHRVFKQVQKNGDEWYQIHEAFYDDGDKKPHSWTEDGIVPGGETIDELRAELKRMLKCLDDPVLEFDENKDKIL